MNIDGNEREQVRELTGLLCDKTVGCDVSGDFTLPEHQPELRRLLSVSAKVLPPAKYVSSSGVECNGTVDYKVFYVGVDGGLWCADFSAEYEFEAPIEDRSADTSGGVDTFVTVICDSASARVSSQRRLSIKSRLCARVRAFVSNTCEMCTYGDVDESSIEKRFLSEKCASVCALSSDVTELSDEVDGLFEDSRVISADATVFVKDVRRGVGGILVDGEVELKLLVCRDGQRAQSMTKKIPFDAQLDCDRPIGDAACRVLGTVTDINITVEEGKASCSLSLILSALTAHNEERSYTADVYSVERECQCETETAYLPAVRACGVGNFSQSERIALSDTGIPEGAQICDIFGSVRFDGCEYGGGKYDLSGQSRYTLLWEKDGEYGSADVELPTKYGLDGEIAENMSFDAYGEIISCRGRTDGELVCIDAEIAVCADVFEMREIRMARAAHFGDPFVKGKNRMVVYYPAEGESVWEVAKKYHVRADSLSEEKNYYLF